MRHHDAWGSALGPEAGVVGRFSAHKAADMQDLEY
jgi:hypothetical protein